MTTATQFSNQSSELFEQFMKNLSKVDLGPSVALRSALGSFQHLAEGKATENQVQAGMDSPEQQAATKTTGNLLSQGFLGLKAFLNALNQTNQLGQAQGNQQSIDQAKFSLAEQHKIYVEPDLQKGRYNGKVLGETSDHVLLSVDGRSNTATAIEKALLGNLPFGLNQTLDLQFRNGQVLGANNSQTQTMSQTQSHRRTPGR